MYEDVTILYIFYINFIYSYGSFIAGLNTAKDSTLSALNCATKVKNLNLNMMGYFDFFLSLTEKLSAFKPMLMNFGGNATTSRVPSQTHKHWYSVLGVPYMHFY